MEAKKHAYLIMAHNEPELLYKLVKCLDDRRNDIYIHLDKRFETISEESLRNSAKFSKVYFLERQEVRWSGYSQIDCEFRLLKAAMPLNYRYYHFISGVDLPIKKQDAIHAFFEEHDGEEFVDVKEVKTWKVASRYKYYHFEKINDRLPRKWSRSLRFVWSMIQVIFFVNKVRNEKIRKYYWGGAWFSITHDFAKYITDREQKIYKVYNHGFYNDEIFLMTYLMNSEFKEKLSPFGYARLIDWDRGNPYVWTSTEFDEIMASDAMFARKFSMNKDAEVIERICNAVCTP